MVNRSGATAVIAAAFLLSSGCHAVPPTAAGLLPTTTEIDERRVEVERTNAEAPTPATPAGFELDLPPTPAPPTIASSVEPVEPTTGEPFVRKENAAARDPRAEEIDRIALEAAQGEPIATRPSNGAGTIVATPPTEPSIKEQKPPAPADPAIERADVVVPTPPAPPKSAEELWREGIGGLIAIAQRESTDTAGAPGLWRFRANLLGCLAEPAIDPDSTDSAQRNRRRALVKALRLVIDPGSESDSESRASRSRQIREAVEALEEQAPLEMPELLLCRKVIGYGDHEPLLPPIRKPGQPVILYAELEGVRYESTAEGFRSKVTSRVEILSDPAAAPVWSLSLGSAEDRCRRKRRDFFISNRFNLPESLPAGTYTLRSIQTDALADASVSREVTLVIQP
ncbi:MAG: hypothetical protein SFX72_00805 [Isosphaeraceae bacterium]|nr:hypothetical protein [Isosphaeraceae bacterium]